MVRGAGRQEVADSREARTASERHGNPVRLPNTKLTVELIGAISVEEYESGKDDIEAIRDRFEDDVPDVPERGDVGGGIDRLF